MNAYAPLSMIIFGFSLLFCACNAEPEAKQKTATATFAELSEEEGFAEKHDEPRKIEQAQLGKMQKITVEGGEDANAYVIKNPKPTNKTLFVIHEWWGLNEHIKTEAEKWFEKLGNVNVMALDLYDGQVAETRENAQKYMQSAKEERILKIIDAAIATLDEGAEVATIGWCFGGGWSLRTALQAGDLTKACVVYYGMPVDDVEQLEKLQSDVLFIYGEKDQWINREVAEQFEANMEKAGKALEVLAFDADHAFANPSSERYVEDAAQEANARALEYLQERLQ